MQGHKFTLLFIFSPHSLLLYIPATLPCFLKTIFFEILRSVIWRLSTIRVDFLYILCSFFIFILTSLDGLDIQCFVCCESWLSISRSKSIDGWYIAVNTKSCKYKELQIHHFLLFWSIFSLFSRPFSLETRLYLVSWDCIKCILHHYLLIFPFDRSFTFLDFNPSHSFRLTIACATISLKRSHDVARGVTTVSCSDRLEQLHLLFVIWSRTTRTCTGPLRKLCTNCHVTRIIVLQCMVVVLSR